MLGLMTSKKDSASESTLSLPPGEELKPVTEKDGTLLGSISSSSSTSSLEHKPNYPKKLNAHSNNRKTMSKSPSVSSRTSAGIYGFFNQAFLVFFILVCLFEFLRSICSK